MVRRLANLELLIQGVVTLQLSGDAMGSRTEQIAPSHLHFEQRARQCNFLRGRLDDELDRFRGEREPTEYGEYGDYGD